MKLHFAEIFWSSAEFPQQKIQSKNLQFITWEKNNVIDPELKKLRYIYCLALKRRLENKDSQKV